MDLITPFSKLIAPPFCTHCRSFMHEYQVVCDSCKLLLKPIISSTLSVGSKKIPVLAIAHYQEPLVSLIRAKNYANPIASKQLAQLIWDMTAIKHQQFDCITPVPLHWLRTLWRGFNQAEIMAQELSKLSGIAHQRLLMRSGYTPFQAPLNKNERQKNVRNIFAVTARAQQYTGKHILLIDDVMTTGSTLRACAQALLSAKPASITAVVAARVLD